MFKLKLSVLLFLCAAFVVSIYFSAGQVLAQDSWASVRDDLKFLHENTQATLLFTPLGSNPDKNYEKHYMTETQIQELCGLVGNCGHMGINFGTFFKLGQYDKIKKFNMPWALEIARKSDPKSVAAAINENPGVNIIVRIGITGNSIGFQDYKGNASDYIEFLKNVSSQAGGKDFYAIAGPNEPDIERWLAPECGAVPGDAGEEAEKFYDCIGEPLAKYMNALCTAKANGKLPENVKLLSPAFNMTSHSFFGIVNAMNEADANWSCLEGAAGNLYPNGKSMQAYWDDNFTGKTIKMLKSFGLEIYITETGPFEKLDGTGSSSALYETIPYDFDQYYIHPIKGLEPTNKDVIRDDLVRQGYEARCAAPGFDIIVNQAGEQAMRDYLRCGARGCNSPGGEGGVLGGSPILGAPDNLGPNPLSERVVSLLTVDYRDALVPVLRDMNRIPQLKRSLEDYFGYREGSSDTYNLAEMRSSGINSLLTNNQRCVQSALSLLQQEKMCEKLEDPSACALYATKVPETELDVEGLLAAYKNSSWQLDNHQEVCGKLIAGPDTELRRGMMNLPLHIENAYRLAFLVTTIRTSVPSTSSMLNLFQHPKRGPLNQGPDPKHVVIVTAFKVPDITTNKGTIDTTSEPESGHTDFNDPSLLTRDVLIPSKIKQQLEKDGDTERQRLLNMGRYVASIPQDDKTMEIECMLSNIGGQQCLDPMTWALVDIINAQSLIETENEQLVKDDSIDQMKLTATQKEQLFKLECSDETPFEPVDYILDPASLDPLTDPGRIFKADWGVAILENLFTDQTHMVTPGSSLNPMYADTNNNKEGGWHWGLKSVFYVTRKNSGAFGKSGTGRTVKHFIVYPEGYDLKTVEAVMSGTFFSSNQIESLREKSKAFENLIIKDAEVLFEGGEASKTFTDLYDCKETTKIGPTGIPYIDRECEEKTFGFKLDLEEEPQPSGVLGGKLGFWMHTIQLQLQRAQALTHKYLENCASTEEFLLDACGGVATTQTAVATDLAQDLNKVTPFSIKYWNGSDVTFQPPSTELWSAISTAASTHGCDPWLLLATAHSESASYTNDALPGADGEQGLFQFSPTAWEKWKTENNSPDNADHHMSQCDYWQPTSFSPRGFNFGSPTDIRAAADSACRRILWTGAQEHPLDSSAFITSYGRTGESPDKETWTSSVNKADYVFRLWTELLKQSEKTATAPRPGYPYASCMGEAPKPTNSEVNYSGRTNLPVYDGVATFYSANVMDTTLNTRETTLREINPSLIDTCEIKVQAAGLADEFAKVQAEAAQNGQLQVVGCVAMLRLGDVAFRQNGNKNDIRLVWVKRPPGAPADVPPVIGPLAVIDVARDTHAIDIFNRYNKKWVLDIDFETFRRLFSWQGGNSWRTPQYGLTVCDTKEQCQ